jgi:hypothetical protein
MRLGEHLRGTDGISAQSMARVRRLLTDGMSPLYTGQPGLAEALSGWREPATGPVGITGAGDGPPSLVSNDARGEGAGGQGRGRARELGEASAVHRE